MYDKIKPSHWSTFKGKRNNFKADALAMVGRQILACWWRLVQVGADIPPLRASMILSLSLPHSFQCSDASCCIPGCMGNQVEMSDGGMVTFTFPHHKSSLSQQGLLSGPITCFPPISSLTSKLTSALLRDALPLLHSLREVEEDEEGSQPTQFLMDVWGSQEHPHTIKAMTSTIFATRFKEVCLGPRCLLPHITSEVGDVLGCISLEPCPYMMPPFNPSVCR